jgi:hypothetical protein
VRPRTSKGPDFVVEREGYSASTRLASRHQTGPLSSRFRSYTAADCSQCSQSFCPFSNSPIHRKEGYPKPLRCLPPCIALPAFYTHTTQDTGNTGNAQQNTGLNTGNRLGTTLGTTPTIRELGSSSQFARPSHTNATRSIRTSETLRNTASRKATGNIDWEQLTFALPIPPAAGVSFTTFITFVPYRL